MKIIESLIVAITAVAIQGCASSLPKVLSVKSDPADAEVCLKAKGRSKYFKQNKNCIGSTPLELEAFTITDDKGNKKQVRFSELEKEQFYVVVSREGYAPQSMVVPSWEHFVILRQETPPAKEFSSNASTVVTIRGTAKINSNPVGALVYVNDFLKGNTPYVLEAESGQTVRLKIEQAGYRSIEQSITMENGKTMEINLSMEKEVDKVVMLKQELK